MAKARTLSTLVFIMLVMAITTSCKKNYYVDSGTTKGDFNGTIMQYLASKPEYFDSLVRVIKIAGFETALNTEHITFFAPADSSIRSVIRETNVYLESKGMPVITSINQIKPAIWRKHLAKYIFKFDKSLNDFPQLDKSNINSYPGQMYTSYDGALMNIGVNYADVVITDPTDPNKSSVIKYAGYRSIILSFLTNEFTPRDPGTWISCTVASVNIKPTNGYVHVLRYAGHNFGFDSQKFAQDVAFNNN